MSPFWLGRVRKPPSHPQSRSPQPTTATLHPSRKPSAATMRLCLPLATLAPKVKPSPSTPPSQPASSFSSPQSLDPTSLFPRLTLSPSLPTKPASASTSRRKPPPTLISPTLSSAMVHSWTGVFSTASCST